MIGTLLAPLGFVLVVALTVEQAERLLPVALERVP